MRRQDLEQLPKDTNDLKVKKEIELMKGRTGELANKWQERTEDTRCGTSD